MNVGSETIIIIYKKRILLKIWVFGGFSLNYKSHQMETEEFGIIDLENHTVKKMCKIFTQIELNLR